jgi:PEP-CTERM motif
MKKNIAIAVLLSIGMVSAQAESIDRETYRVSHPHDVLHYFDGVTDSEGLKLKVYEGDAYSGTDNNNDSYTNFSAGAIANDLVFTAQDGYRIDGYKVDYEVVFNGSSYLATGKEGSSFEAGKTYYGEATISSDRGGASFSFSAQNDSGILNRTYYLNDSKWNGWLVQGTVQAQGRLFFCVDLSDCKLNGLNQYIPQPSASIESRISLNSITITPQVSAIPEPSSYALILAGMGFMGAIARRRSSSFSIQ